jgi:ABC-type lipopolysaccharide export system ATPase subunit
MRLYTTNLVKRYKTRTVVNEVSVDVEQGEIVGLSVPTAPAKHHILHDCGTDTAERRPDMA